MDSATSNWKIHLLGSSISFLARFCLNKKVLSSWTLIVLSPSRRHSCSEGTPAALALCLPGFGSAEEDTDLQDEKRPSCSSRQLVTVEPGACQCWVRNVYSQNFLNHLETLCTWLCVQSWLVRRGHSVSDSA